MVILAKPSNKKSPSLNTSDTLGGLSGLVSSSPVSNYISMSSAHRNVTSVPKTFVIRTFFKLYRPSFGTLANSR